ncbi:hypothetical protein BB560_006789 [Smittium megazygosporum]|uniref:Signal peptidase complex catalytic subunit SEC11 n=1 Tax=Smittium megazygosporum TaxID=133381 RepID=A0A2T9Y1J2_9FUNG|nr:hypothetical protein BB560_006789 [Smittium megazygosporum]
MYDIKGYIRSNGGIRNLLRQGLVLLSVITSAFMIWKALSLYTNCESPAVVVLSGSMEPAFYRGDVLFLTNGDSPIEIGEIIETGKQYILTKGDNNNVDDRGLYAKNQLWIEREHIFGRVYGFVPYVGLITIIMSDYPKIKYLVLAALCVMSLFESEQ